MFGGGVSSHQGNQTVIDSTISGNVSSLDGAAFMLTRALAAQHRPFCHASQR